MSDFEQLWFDPVGDHPEAVASVLAEKLGMKLTRDRGHVIVSGTEENGFAGPVGGAIEVNVYTAMEQKIDPEDFAVFDDVPMIWQLWSPDREEQQALAL